MITSALGARRTFASAYWVTMRPYLLPVSGASGLVGLAMVDALPTSRVAVGLAAFTLAYGFGQALTDVTQVDTDALSAPYRPLVSGELRRRDVLVASAAGLALCASALFVLSPWTLVLAALSVAGLATYTSMKRRFWAGPAHNSWIVALLPAMGALSSRESIGTTLRSPIVWAAMASVFFSYATFVLLGYLKDVEADRTTGYRTLPVRFGRPITVAVSALCAALALVASLAMVSRTATASTPSSIVGGIAWLIGASMLVAAHLRARTITRDQEAHLAIATCVRGFVALHLAEATLLRPTFAVLAVVVYVAFELALAARPCKEQV